MSKPTMRAKMIVRSVTKHQGGQEELRMTPVATGSAEDNTYSKFTPCGDLTLHITNENLYGHLNAGDAFYVDFTKADQAEVAG